MRKYVYMGLGVLSLALGIVGIFIPGLPTTPFVLLSSWLFYRSSQRWHYFLHRSRWLGKYIEAYESRRGVSRLSKGISLICMWSMISLSAFCFIDSLSIRFLLFLLGGIGTGSILFLVPGTKEKCKK